MFTLFILATRPEDGAVYSDEETPAQAKSRQHEQDRMMAEFSQRENQRLQQHFASDSIDSQHSETMQIQSSGNGVVVIGSNDFN